MSTPIYARCAEDCPEFWPEQRGYVGGHGDRNDIKATVADGLSLRFGNPLPGPALVPGEPGLQEPLSTAQHSGRGDDVVLVGCAPPTAA